jgi:GT2 family glycosyltransferase
MDASQVPDPTPVAPEVTVIIPNWNGQRLLPACLAALCRQRDRSFQVIVVDNGSTDGSVEWLRQHYPAVRLIVNQRNLGFAAAINQGIISTESRWVATLNNDTEVAEGWLSALVQAADSDPIVGMCASKMLFAHQPEMINSAGICLDLAGIAWDCCGGKPNSDSDQKTHEVFGPCGGAALYRRKMLEEIGLFDEDFFAYLEDVDLAWRARRAGWSALHVPSARVLHNHSATGVEGSPFKSFHLGRNKIWLLVKNYPFRQAWAYGFLCLLYDFAAVAYALVGRRDPYALYGRVAALSGLRRMWRKRHTGRTWDRFDSAWFAPLKAPWRVPDRYRHIPAAEE